ncbi:MAG: SurA N-terminal domain-containing protein [Polyangiaceae bacterium]|jgi:peptidyl-prolyl cis-trans isomerase D|nr:SurA N-terminal domain-containing protein [Polyangiaceae bacterium]
MLDVFRSQGLKNTIYGLLIASIIVVFVVQFRPGGNGQKGGALKQDCAAEVRGECLSSRDFRTTFGLLARRMDDNRLKRLQVRKRVVDGLVERELLVRDAARLGVGISDDDLNAALTSGQVLLSMPAELPDFVLMYNLGLLPDRPLLALPVKGADGQFDKKEYDKVLRQFIKRGAAEFREQQQQEHLAARVRDLVRARVRVSEDEAFGEFLRRKGRVSAKFVRFDRAWFAQYAVADDDAAVDAWALEHKDEVDKAWQARKGEGEASCKLARAVSVAWPEGSTDNDKAALRRQVDAARARVSAKGGNFAEAARELNNDPSIDPSGNLGCAVEARMPKPMAEALAALKDGETSAVGESDKGFFFVHLDAALTGERADAQGRREAARERRRGLEAEAKTSESARKMRELVAAGKTLEQALAEAVGPYLAAADAQEKRAAERRREAAKPAKGAKNPKDAKDAKGGDDDAASEPPAPPRAANRGEAPKVEEAKDVGREGAPVRGLPFGVDLPSTLFALEKAGDVSDLVKLDSGYLVAQLSAKTSPSRADFDQDKERESYRTQLLAAKRHDALASYVARLRDAAKAEIKINPDYVKDGAASPGEAGDEE